MAKVKNPFFSLVATGSFGKIMTANRGLKTQVMRSTPLRKINGLTPAEIKTGTPAQAAQRELLKSGLAAWRLLPASEKASYATRAYSLEMSGYNLFMREWMLTPPTPAGTVWDSGLTSWDSGLTTWDA